MRPRLECRIADGPLEAPSDAAERGPALGMEADREEPARRATGGEASHGAADDSQAASSPGAAPDAAGLNDKIGSEDEVFEMARARSVQPGRRGLTWAAVETSRRSSLCR